MGGAMHTIADGALDAERNAAPWIQRFARFGYGAKGVVYALVAVLALRAAIGPQSATGSRGALETLLHQPFGRIMLAVVALGLVCFALWFAYRALRNPENDDAKDRVADGFSAIFHIALALSAARYALSGNDGGTGGEQTMRATASALQQPLGILFVIAVGGGIIVHALWQIYRAADSRLDDQLDLSALSATQRRWAERIAGFGIAARGVVFLLIGIFLVVAAVQYEPSAARDFGGALRTLERQPFGRWLLALVAFGLFAYGAYQLMRARYRVVRTGGAAPQTSIRLKRVG